MKRIFALLAFLACFLPNALGQGTNAGQETTIQYTGLNVPIVNPNTPVSNLAGPNGTNTFIIPLANPSVSIRFYITNNTANACATGLTAQLFAASDPQVFSFNNSLANWQIVPLQNTSNALVGTLTVPVPASGSMYFSSGAISSPKVVLQLVASSTAACPTTSIEVTGVITQIAVTVPLVSTNGPGNFSTGAGQVQGVVPQQASGAQVNPIVSGGLAPAINSQFFNVGLDNFSTTQVVVPGGPGVTATLGVVPPPSNQNEVAIALSSGFAPISGPNPTILAPWTQAGSLAPGDNSALIGSVLTGAVTGTALKENYQNGINPPGGGTAATITNITLWPFGTTVRQASNVSTGGSYISATLAGSTLMVGMRCTGTVPCNGNLTDSQGNNWVQVVNTAAPGFIPPGQLLFISTTKAQAAADTLTMTITAGTGATGQLAAMELVVPGASPLVQPAVSIQLDPLGAQVVRPDAQAPNQVNCSVTISTNTTTQLTGCGAPANLSLGGVTVPVRLYITDIQFNTTTAGTTTILTLKTGTGSNCGTGTANLSAITYTNTAVGLLSLLSSRTPLIAPISSAVCLQQSGTTPGTTTAEIRGFIAP